MRNLIAIDIPATIFRKAILFCVEQVNWGFRSVKCINFKWKNISMQNQFYNFNGAFIDVRVIFRK